MAKVKVKGVIVSADEKWIYDYFEIESTSPKDVDIQIEAAKDEDLEVEISSPGGDVYSGSEIYTALKSYKGNVVVKIVGIAASAASVIAMAGKKVMISPTAQIMIHNVASRARGDYRAMEHEAGVLKNYNKSIANSYILKTGMAQDELLQLMNKETWLTAQDAVKYRFADEIMFDENMQLVAGIQSAMLPKEVITAMRKLLINSNGQINPEAVFSLPEEPQKEEPQPEASRQVPVDLYTKLYQDLERRAKIC